MFLRFFESWIRYPGKSETVQWSPNKLLFSDDNLRWNEQWILSHRELFTTDTISLWYSKILTVPECTNRSALPPPNRHRHQYARPMNNDQFLLARLSKILVLLNEQMNNLKKNISQKRRNKIKSNFLWVQACAYMPRHILRISALLCSLCIISLFVICYTGDLHCEPSFLQM